MKTIIFVVLALAAVSFSQADNDGRYHPEYYSGYKSLAYRNGKYGSIYNPYQQPSYYQALNRELLTPAVSYDDSVQQPLKAVFPATVTYRTPVSTTYRPFVYSTPKPFALSSTAAPVPVYPKSVPAVVYQKSTPAAIYHKSVPDAAASIVRQDRNYDENNYHYAYETDNGIAAEESGIVDSSVNGVGGGTRVRGFYEYIGDDGLKYRVDYIADENGFRASGAHLPKAP
ncbi:hypothetical protein PYW07_015319 [Mythimna separata]|uniref:Uncharacterized protein n=1 Tax=Mythimna separata TaxID=271217 RepID=A0AAD8DYC6_MYTSE|nr:hypothetical protein PYW07_015319 [Mythimna separata]